MAKCKNCKNLIKRYDHEPPFVCFAWCPKINDCPIDNFEMNCRDYEPKTNADRIRNMTDEELAEFIVNLENHFGEEYEGEQSCLAWLQKESEECSVVGNTFDNPELLEE